MEFQGGCYCGGLRYEAKGEPLFKGQCHCRECQYASGGHPNVVLGMPLDGFAYTKGSPKGFQRKDLENGVVREFCPECGTHILTRTSAIPNGVLLKVGTMDDPSLFGTPQMAIYLCDKQPFHQVPEGIPTFDRTPGG